MFELERWIIKHLRQHSKGQRTDSAETAEVFIQSSVQVPLSGQKCCSHCITDKDKVLNNSVCVSLYEYILYFG